MFQQIACLVGVPFAGDQLLRITVQIKTGANMEEGLVFN